MCAYLALFFFTFQAEQMVGLPFGKYLGTYSFIPSLNDGSDPCPSAPCPALKSLQEPGYQDRYYVVFVVDNPLPKDQLKNDLERDVQNQSRLCKKSSLVNDYHFPIIAIMTEYVLTKMPF